MPSFPGPSDGGRAADTALAAARDSLRGAHAGARVLVAEDNPVNQGVVVELLTSAGLRVDVANDGQEAVDKTALADYDLVLLDVRMPRVDGCDACRVIRRGPRHGSVPILALTAGASSGDRDATSAAGIDGHLTKPLDPVVLYGAVARWLETGRHRPRAPLARGSAHAVAGGAAAELADADGPDDAAGLDVAAGLRFFGGARGAYLAALRLFAGLYGAGLPACDSAAALRRELHGAGSACSHIGASALGSEARRLETLAVDGDNASADAAFLAAGRAFSVRLAKLSEVVADRVAALAR